jgi:hypothetical protein
MELSGDVIDEVIGAAMVKFDYKIKPDYVEITYKSIDSEVCMRIISGLILCGFRHINIMAGNIRAYFDDSVALIIHW